MRYATFGAACVVMFSMMLSAQSTGTPSPQAAVAPVPRTTFDGPALSFDFPGLEVGVAEYDEGPTGTTVFYFPRGANGVVDVRGGAPGTVNTDTLRLGYEVPTLDAVTFAGGSAYGLSVFAGVADELRLLRDRTGSPSDAPGRGGRPPARIVSAILFDLSQRFTSIVPDTELGRAAFKARRPGHFPLGARGAGRMSSLGVQFGERGKGGQGAAFRQIGATKVMVFAVLNGGSAVDRQGNVLACTHPASSGIGHSVHDHWRSLLRPAESQRAALDAPSEETGAGYSLNTNLFLVVTNQKLPYADLQRLAVQVHTSLARAIQPFNTRGDGDVLYAVSTQEVDNSALPAGTLNLHASDLAWDAVIAAVPPMPVRATNRPSRVSDGVSDRYVGEYEFAPQVTLGIRREGRRLLARATGARSIYSFNQKTDTPLLAESETIFYEGGRFEDRLQFVTDSGGRVTGLILNPGLQHISARRIR